MTILVVGSTGTLGGLVVQFLRESNLEVSALVRDPGSAASRNLRSIGAHLVIGDLKKASQMDAAVRGIRTVVITATATLSRREGDSLEAVDGSGLQGLITACVQNGVQHVVFVSFSHGIDADTPLARFKRAAERRLQNTSMEYSILLPSYFPEKFVTPLVGFDLAAKRVRIYGDGTSPIAYVSTADVARLAAICASSVKGRGMIPMGGPDNFTQLQVVDIAKGVVGGAFELDYLSLDQIQASMEATLDPLRQSHLGLYRGLALGDTPSTTWMRQFEIKPIPLVTCLERMWRPARSVAA